MAISKVAYDGHTLIDLTQDTAVESDVASGKTFHKADGTIGVGTASGGGGTVNLQNKTVNLGSAAPSSVSADAGYDGLGQVSFNTSNINAANIKSGASVCGIAGSYAGVIPSFPHALSVTIDSVDGTYQLDLTIAYRKHNSNGVVVWDTLTPTEVESEGYYHYYATLYDATDNTYGDGFYLFSDHAINTTTDCSYILIDHTSNTYKYYVMADASNNSISIEMDAQ